jgi:hypothetical protein
MRNALIEAWVDGASFYYHIFKILKQLFTYLSTEDISLVLLEF